MDKVSFNKACDDALDRITAELIIADVTDEKQIKVLTDNAKHLREAKEGNKGILSGVLGWLGELTPGDILKASLSVMMYAWILNKEDDGIVVTTRGQGWIPWNKSPK